MTTDAPKRFKRIIGILFLLLLIAIISGACFWFFGLDYLASQPPKTQARELTIEIPRGASVDRIARALEREGLISNRLLFIAYLRRQEIAKRLQAGEYRLNTAMSIKELSSALLHGRPKEKTVTIPEGLTLEQTAKRLAANGAIGEAEEFIALGASTEMLALAGAAGPTVEGFLFPDTYFFGESDNSATLMRRMIRAFNTKADDAFSTSTLSGEERLERLDLITMASLIEREARSIEEMPMIASVYYNRLRLGMLLQCDASVRYGLGQVWDRKLTYKDLKDDSPYNTYRYKGLPPGPICSPGVQALRAAARPAESDYLFYVYRGDGRHEFTRTYEEHKAASRKYLK